MSAAGEHHVARRILVALVALALVACGAPGAPSPSAPMEVPTPSPDTSAPESPAAQPTTPEPTPAPPSGDVTNGLTLVQFRSSDDPASQVFVIDGDGNLRQLTGGSGTLPGATGPQWSPDGAWLAFNPPKVGAKVIPDLGVVRADGSEEHVIGQGINPRWSPDGTRVLFQQVEPIED